MDCIRASVAAVYVRKIGDVAEEHKARMHGETHSWEMIVPELVFAPR